MSKGLISFSAIGLMLAGATLMLTNPSENAYINSVSDKLCHSSNTAYDTVKKFICIGAKPLIDKTVMVTTQRDNYVFFSVYTTKIVNYEYRAIGVLGNFVPVK